MTSPTTKPKPYYKILGLSPPSSNSSTSPLDPVLLRTHYRAALLAAHPDKQIIGAAKTLDTGAGASAGNGVRRKWSIDSIKEAFSVLGDSTRRRDYDLLLNSASTSDTAAKDADLDFILGLEVLDLDDFSVREGDGGGEQEWVRSCRCGEGAGFRIREEELQGVWERGGREVLLGCEGCSLWVRVGFAVLEGEGG